MSRSHRFRFDHETRDEHVPSESFDRPNMQQQVRIATMTGIIAQLSQLTSSAYGTFTTLVNEADGVGRRVEGIDEKLRRIESSFSEYNSTRKPVSRGSDPQEESFREKTRKFGGHKHDPRLQEASNPIGGSKWMPQENKFEVSQSGSYSSLKPTSVAPAAKPASLFASKRNRFEGHLSNGQRDTTSRDNVPVVDAEKNPSSITSHSWNSKFPKTSSIHKTNEKQEKFGTQKPATGVFQGRTDQQGKEASFHPTHSAARYSPSTQVNFSSPVRGVVGGDIRQQRNEASFHPTQTETRINPSAQVNISSPIRGAIGSDMKQQGKEASFYPTHSAACYGPSTQANLPSPALSVIRDDTQQKKNGIFFHPTQSEARYNPSAQANFSSTVRDVIEDNTKQQGKEASVHSTHSASNYNSSAQANSSSPVRAINGSGMQQQQGNEHSFHSIPSVACNNPNAQVNFSRPVRRVMGDVIEQKSKEATFHSADPGCRSKPSAQVNFSSPGVMSMAMEKTSAPSPAHSQSNFSEHVALAQPVNSNLNTNNFNANTVRNIDKSPRWNERDCKVTTPSNSHHASSTNAVESVALRPWQRKQHRNEPENTANSSFGSNFVGAPSGGSYQMNDERNALNEEGQGGAACRNVIHPAESIGVKRGPCQMKLESEIAQTSEPVRQDLPPHLRKLQHRSNENQERESTSRRGVFGENQSSATGNNNENREGNSRGKENRNCPSSAPPPHREFSPMQPSGDSTMPKCSLSLDVLAQVRSTKVKPETTNSRKLVPERKKHTLEKPKVASKPSTAQQIEIQIPKCSLGTDVLTQIRSKCVKLRKAGYPIKGKSTMVKTAKKTMMYAWKAPSSKPKQGPEKKQQRKSMKSSHTNPRPRRRPPPPPPPRNKKKPAPDNQTNSAETGEDPSISKKRVEDTSNKPSCSLSLPVLSDIRNNDSQLKLTTHPQKTAAPSAAPPKKSAPAEIKEQKEPEQNIQRPQQQLDSDTLQQQSAPRQQKKQENKRRPTQTPKSSGKKQGEDTEEPGTNASKPKRFLFWSKKNNSKEKIQPQQSYNDDGQNLTQAQTNSSAHVGDASRKVDYTIPEETQNKSKVTQPETKSEAKKENPKKAEIDPPSNHPPSMPASSLSLSVLSDIKKKDASLRPATKVERESPSPVTTACAGKRNISRPSPNPSALSSIPEGKVTIARGESSLASAQAGGEKTNMPKSALNTSVLSAISGGGVELKKAPPPPSSTGARNERKDMPKSALNTSVLSAISGGCIELKKAHSGSESRVEPKREPMNLLAEIRGGRKLKQVKASAKTPAKKDQSGFEGSKINDILARRKMVQLDSRRSSVDSTDDWD